MATERRIWARSLALGLGALQVTFGIPLLAPISAAQAQVPPPRVWLGPLKTEDVPGVGLLSEKFDEATRKQLNRSTKVETTDKAKVAQVTAGEADPRVEQAATLRVAGKEAYAAKKYKDAAQKLSAALALYEEGLASISKVEVIAETLGYLGAVSIAQGFDADAKDYFRRVVALVPDAEPLDEFSEDAKASFQKHKKKLLKKKRGTLSITSDPPGAVVRVDGLEKGKTPLKVKDLVRGDHYVQVSHDEAGLGAQRVRVKGGKTKDVTISLSKSVGPEPAQKADAAVVAQVTALAKEGDLGEQFREKADAIATQTRADYVVVGHIAPRSNNFVLTAYIYGTKEKQVAAFDEFKFRADLSSVFVQAAAFATAIEAAANKFPFDKVVVGGIVVAKAPAPPKDPPPAREPDPPPAEKPPERKPVADNVEPVPVNPPDDDDDDAWYASWWLWTLVGVAVIGGTAYGGYLLVKDEGSSSTFDAEVRW